MATERWKLHRFQECLARWVAMSFPPDDTVRQVATWITDRLPYNAFPAGSKRFNEDPTMRYVTLPFRSTDNRFVLIGWQIDSDSRQLTCVLLEEVTENTRP